MFLRICFVLVFHFLVFTLYLLFPKIYFFSKPKTFFMFVVCVFSTFFSLIPFLCTLQFLIGGLFLRFVVFSFLFFPVSLHPSYLNKKCVFFPLFDFLHSSFCFRFSVFLFFFTFCCLTSRCDLERRRGHQ